MNMIIIKCESSKSIQLYCIMEGLNLHQSYIIKISLNYLLAISLQNTCTPRDN